MADITTLTVYTYGAGQQLQDVFNSVVMAVRDPSYQSLIHIVLALGFIFSLALGVTKRSWMITGKWFVMYIAMYTVLFVPTATIQIDDRVFPGQAITIANVPLGLAVAASSSSSVGYGLATIAEKVFSMPDNLDYTKTGMGMGAKLLEEATTFKITDPTFEKNMASYVQQCVFYDILLGKYSLSDLMSTSNIWQYVSEKASPARAFLYNGQVTICSDGIKNLTNDWQSALNHAENFYSTQVYGEQDEAKAQFLSRLGDASQFYLNNTSTAASTIMQQSLMMNAIRAGIGQFGAITNSDAAIQNFAFSRAQTQKRMDQQTVAQMAAYWLPIMQDVFSAILDGAFFFVFLLALTPWGDTIGKYYLLSMFWLQLWTPMFAIINMMVQYYAKHQIFSLTTATGGYTLMSMGGIAQINSDISSLAGYMSMSVPFLTFYLIKFSPSILNSVASYAGGLVQSAAVTGAGEALTGNMSYGNTSFDNQSAFNTNSNHFNTNASYASGMATTQLASGASMSVMQDGTSVLNTSNSMSNLPIGINLSESIRTAATQQADMAYSSAINDAKSYSDSMTSVIRGLDDFGSSQSLSQSSGVSDSVSQQAGLHNAFNQVNQLVDKFAQTHNISHANALKFLGDAYASASVDSKNTPIGKALEASIGFSGGAGLKGDAEFSHTRQNQTLFEAAQEFTKNTNFNQTVDAAIRATEENSFRTSNEEASRLSKDISSSLEQANRASQDMTTQYNESESYHKMASFASENSANINDSFSQNFFEFVSNQPAPGAQSGRMGAYQASSVMNDPVQREYYAKQFVGEQTQQFMKDWNQGMASSPADIRSNYNNNSQNIPGNPSVSEINQSRTQSIQNTAGASGMGKGSIVDRSAIDQTKNLTGTSVNMLESNSSNLNRNTQSIQNTTTENL